MAAGDFWILRAVLRCLSFFWKSDAMTHLHCMAANSVCSTLRCVHKTCMLHPIFRNHIPIVFTIPSQTAALITSIMKLTLTLSLLFTGAIAQSINIAAPQDTSTVPTGPVNVTVLRPVRDFIRRYCPAIHKPVPLLFRTPSPALLRWLLSLA